MVQLSRYLKGTIAVTELEHLPMQYIQVIYKQYAEFLNDKSAQEAAGMEEMVEAMEDGMM